MSTPTPNPPIPNKSTFHVVSQSEEDSYDYAQHRGAIKTTGLVASIAHLVKGALGAGILGGHVAYMKSGIALAVPLNIAFGVYMGLCLHMLIEAAHIMYKRTAIPVMSYPDLGEAAVACFPNIKVAKLSKIFRYSIDAIIIIDLYGSCACYQIIIAKSIKQLVENTHHTTIEGKGGYPDIRIYLLAMMIPVICICLITHLKWLAPFALVANGIIVLCILMAIYYAVHLNPSFDNLRLLPLKPTNFFEFTGMMVFAMSCSGVVLPVENNMAKPKKFPVVLLAGMSLIVLCTFSVAFFGYAGFLEECESPITVNFPMELFPKILKGLIAVMLYITHAINFWVPFNLCFHYIKKCHKKHIMLWELFYRAVFVTIISTVAIIFPNINSLMGFLGAFCLSNMAFIWPNIISLLVFWHRPGLGKYKWRLWRSVIFITIGIFIWICGSMVNGRALINMLIK